MAGGKIGIFRAVLRYFRFWNWKKARGLIKVADEHFTDSVDGIAAAFDIQKDRMVKQYLDLRDAIAELEAVLEDKRARLEELNREKEELLAKREGATVMAERAKEENALKEYERHSQASERFQARIEEIEQTRERLRGKIADTSHTMDKYMPQLQDLQSRIEKIPQQKAEAIADFISAKQIIELNGRLQELDSSQDSGPIAAVLEANKRLAAKARISEKLTKVDVPVQENVQEKEYEKAVKDSTARQKDLPGDITPVKDSTVTAFISYDWANHTTASRLASNLEEDGIDVWWDKNKIEPGDSVDGIISNAINKCAVFIPLVSRETRNIQNDSGKLKYHCREWEWAYGNMISKKNPRKIIPVKIDGCDWMYDKFQNLSFISIKGGKRVGDYNKLKEKLLKLQNELKNKGR